MHNHYHYQLAAKDEATEIWPTTMNRTLAQDAPAAPSCHTQQPRHLLVQQHSVTALPFGHHNTQRLVERRHQLGCSIMELSVAHWSNRRREGWEKFKNGKISSTHTHNGIDNNNLQGKAPQMKKSLAAM